MPKSTFLRNRVLDAVFTNQTLNVPVAYMSLHTADPGLTGASEVVGGSYARKALTMSAASAGATANTAIVEFAGMPAVTVTHVGVWSLVSGGNFLYGKNATANKTYGAGDKAEVAIGALTASET
jgi:hypothetical protein